jgi:hypothetical protein
VIEFKKIINSKEYLSLVDQKIKEFVPYFNLIYPFATLIENQYFERKERERERKDRERERKERDERERKERERERQEREEREREDRERKERGFLQNSDKRGGIQDILPTFNAQYLSRLLPSFNAQYLSRLLPYPIVRSPA